MYRFHSNKLGKNSMTPQAMTDTLEERSRSLAQRRADTSCIVANATENKIICPTEMVELCRSFFSEGRDLETYMYINYTTAYRYYIYTCIYGFKYIYISCVCICVLGDTCVHICTCVFFTYMTCTYEEQKIPSFPCRWHSWEMASNTTSSSFWNSWDANSSCCPSSLAFWKKDSDGVARIS